MRFSSSALAWFCLVSSLTYPINTVSDALAASRSPGLVLRSRPVVRPKNYGSLTSRSVLASPTQTKTADDTSSTHVDLDERECKEMDWLIRSTAKFLGENSPPLGSMTPALVQKGISVMRGWSRRSSKPNSQAPHVVERILRRLVDERDAGNNCFTIHTGVYNVVINSWAMSDEDGAAQRAEDILTQMETMYEEGNERVRPNEDSYNGVIKAWVKGGRRQFAVAKAESIMDRLKLAAQKDDNPLQPTRRGYNLLLYAIANNIRDDAADRAEEILKEMEAMYAAGNEDAKPDVNSYNQVITSIARGRKPGFEHRATEFFDKLMAEDSEVKPDTDTFNAVLGCWLKSRDKKALQHIEELLELMEKCYSAGNEAAKPDRVTFNTAMVAFTKQGNNEKVAEVRKMMRRYKLKPDTISSNIVIDSWAKSGRRDAPERVMDLLDAMERDFIKGKKQMMPDGYTYSSVIDSFVRCRRPDAALQAENLLERMNDLHIKHGGDKPGRTIYNAVINAWAVCRSTKKAIERTQSILTEMEEDETIANPDRITYNTVIKALGKGRDDDHAALAEKLLGTMKKLAEDNVGLQPDCYTYTAVITAYGKSKSREKARKALELLTEMLESYEAGDLGAKPNTPTYNAALNACAFFNGTREQREETFSILLKIAEMLFDNVEPDVMTYGTLLRACSKLLSRQDKRREEFALKYFEECREAGMVAEMVITQLRFAASPELYKLLTGKGFWEDVNIDDLPSNWTHKVRHQKRIWR